MLPMTQIGVVQLKVLHENRTPHIFGRLYSGRCYCNEFITLYTVTVILTPVLDDDLPSAIIASLVANPPQRDR